MIHKYNEYNSAIVKDETPPLATTIMDLESVMLREINQMEKDKNYMISLICQM